MKQNEKQQISDAFSTTCKKVYAGIIAIAVLCVLTIFPLYYHDYYYDILPSKYQFYYVTMIAMFVIVLLASLIFMAIEGLDYKFGHTLPTSCSTT